jgi:hypothetical protein
MFVEAELSMPLAFDAARRALDDALADGGLVSESRRAVEDGLVFVMPVGPLGTRMPAQEVVVRLLPGRLVGHAFTVPMRWELTGPAGLVFPALDANLELIGVDHKRSRLSITGRYEPPLGRLGATVDRAVMAKVASATMNALLQEISAHLRGLSAPQCEA